MRLQEKLELFIPLKYRDTVFEFLFSIYRLLPFSFVYGLIHKDLKTLNKKINLYYSIFPLKKRKYINEINFLNNKSRNDHQFSYVFPYPFSFNYNTESVNVYKDETNGLFYVIHNGKKLYYSRFFKTEDEVKLSYNYVAIEQDKDSPHCYLNDTFTVNENDVVVDIGAAEGNFSLDVVERASKLYIFETDANWVEALNETFKPWKDKVYIINKFVSNINNDNCTTLDTFLGNESVNFIKIDVEGAEILILKSSKDLFDKNVGLKIAICTYHKTNHARKIENILLKYNFNCSFSNGYMLFLSHKILPPYFRRGLIRAQKTFN